VKCGGYALNIASEAVIEAKSEQRKPVGRSRIMRVDPTYTTNLVSSLDQTQATEQELTSELSSGVSITSLSQNPVGAGENVLLLNQIQQDDSFTHSASLVTGQLQVADSALGSVVSELTQAVSLATSANNGTMNASDVKSISNQISGILDEVQSLANTNYQGQYIFGGGGTSVAPFSTSTADSPAVTSYSGGETVNYLVLPNGQKIQLNVPGDQIFLGSAGNSVFGALNALVADYASGTVNNEQAVSDTTALSSALNYVSQQRVVIDNSMTQLNSASGAVTNEQTQLTTAQTDLMQADIPSISTQLSLAETQQTALEDVIAQLDSVSNSLFSKLQVG
jgi:flagellar hook-associated protein 3 FlgL